MFLIRSESSQALHRQQRNWNVPRSRNIVNTSVKQSMWHQWLNFSFAMLREYFWGELTLMCINKCCIMFNRYFRIAKKNSKLFTNLFSLFCKLRAFMDNIIYDFTRIILAMGYIDTHHQRLQTSVHRKPMHYSYLLFRGSCDVFYYFPPLLR